MYADGDPIAELPVTVRALPSAVRVIVPAMSRARRRRSWPRARSAGLARRAGRGGGTSLPGKVLMRLEPHAIARARGAAAARLGGDLGDERQDHDRRDDGRRSLERAGIPLVHNRAGANMAGGVASTLLARRARRRQDRRRARAVRGRRVLARPDRARARARARCCSATCSATSSTATASSRRSPIAGRRSVAHCRPAPRWS